MNPDVWVPGTEPVPDWWATGQPCASRRCGHPTPHAHRPGTYPWPALRSACEHGGLLLTRDPDIYDCIHGCGDEK